MQSSSRNLDTMSKTSTFNGCFSKNILIKSRKTCRFTSILLLEINPNQTDSMWNEIPYFFIFTDNFASNSVYSDEYMKSLEEPEEFWGEIAAPPMIHWDKPYEKVLDNSNSPFTKWFVGGYLNACYNCVDRHVLAGNGDKVAIIHDSPLTNTIRKVTYQELYDTVWHCINFSENHCVKLIRFHSFLIIDFTYCWRSSKTGRKKR